MEPYMGEIRVFSFGFNPKQWALCNGQTLSIQQNSALFTLLGTSFGGNGTTTFQLPNLQGATMLGIGNGGGITYPLGTLGGVESVTLNTTQIPMHNHFVQVVDSLGVQQLNNSDDYLAQVGIYVSNQQSQEYASNAYTATSPAPAPVTLFPNTIAPAGGNQPHENRMPFLTLSVCIALTGIYPSRN
jgi:microcystin-dependent protein